MSFRDRRAAVLGCVLVLVAVCSASAQEIRSDRPYRGLFGAGGGKDPGQSLTLDWNLLGAYDNNLAADTATAIDPRFVLNGEYAAANATLTYARHTEHRSFSASGTSTGRYYPDLHALSAFEGGGGIAVASDLGRRTRIDLSQTFSHQPYYGVNFLSSVVPSDAAPVVAGDQSGQIALGSQSSDALDGRIGLTRTLGPRASVRADYSYRSIQFGGTDETFSWQLANFAVSKNLTRYAAFHVGYGYGVGKDTFASDSPSVVNHNLDLGIDYNRQLSFSRRTSVNFSSGSTAVVDRGTTHYRLLGNAGLNQEIGRTWRATATYNRGVQYLPGFGQTFFADTAQVRVGGLLGRRIEAGMAGGYSTGQLGFEESAASYSSGTASADMRVAMSRVLSFFAQYTYYRYGFDSGVQVPFGLPPQLNRQALRIGISGWLPLIR